MNLRKDLTLNLKVCENSKAINNNYLKKNVHHFDFNKVTEKQKRKNQ